MRYCPMCNALTGVAVELIAPFRIVTCGECGHIHSISEERVDRRPPLSIPLWRYANR